MPAPITNPLRCSGCARSHAAASDQSEWNGDYAKGVLRAVICPGCQTPAQSVEALVNAALIGPGTISRTPDGRARIIEPGMWTRVEAAAHPLVQDDPDVHLAMTVRDGTLLISVARHSDAALVSALAPGPCAEVATAALSAAGATRTGRRVTVTAADNIPADTAFLAADHAALEDHEDRSELILLFSPDIDPALLRAVAPDIAAAMRSQLRSTVGVADGPRGLPGQRTDGTDLQAVGLVTSGPAWQQFWYGAADSGFDLEAGLRGWIERVMADSDATALLATRYGLTWSELPADHRAQLHIPTAGDGPGLSLATLMLSTREADWEWDRRFTRVCPDRLPSDLRGLVPTHLSALRSGLVTPAAFQPDRRRSPAALQAHRVAALATTAAYLAIDHAHFVPADLALDVATTTEPDAGTLQALRLPGLWNLVLHEPVPVRAISADDDELEVMTAHGVVLGREQAVLGAVLAAHPDHTVDTSMGLVLVTDVDDRGTRRWYLHPAAYGSHPAGRLLYSYAAQLSFAAWLNAPEPPARGTSGKPDSANQLKRLARHPAVRAGALHRMRVLDYTPPPAEPAAPLPSDGTGTPLSHSSTRRAFWKPGVRIGIRDSSGRMVGPVYKDGAVEGETFNRERRWIRRSTVRPDLPPRPDRRVYELTNDPATAAPGTTPEGHDPDRLRP
ncbi:hypothetical protein [Kitasatospora sp. MBT63]|uniref:hypothetical protein n=1 Tax=Kitasatospora sp. MBT63 TaxID=1444768 RepID=UPI001E5B6402|nr:hypothetical protein [Kitasatospora sp. MBT63]